MTSAQVQIVCQAAAWLLLAIPGLGSADANGTTLESALDALVNDALAANLELLGSDAEVAQRRAALDQARARLRPTVDFGLRYSRADGGRTIDVPIGDLLNPVYDALDDLLTTAGQPQRFEPIDNVSFPLLREREQETAISLSQPIYDPRLGAAARASRHEVAASEQARQALRATVLRDVRQGYFALLAADESVRILEASIELARANVAVNESLYRNGRVTRDLVFRAEADLLEIEQQRLEAANLTRQARSLINILRAAPLTEPVPVVPIDAEAVAAYRDEFTRRLAGRAPDLDLLSQLALERRRELAGLDAAIAAGLAREDVARAAFKPRVAFAVDAGYEGEEFSYGSERRFVLASVIVRFNLYAGGGDQARMREAAALTDELRVTRERAAQQIRLEVQRALDDVEVAGASIETAGKRLDAAEGAFRIAARKRDLGAINQTEFIDARRALTSARLNLNVTRARFLGRLSELEYAVGIEVP
ncbi:MAG TPA: TolC family protein [Steroidobacteraceae bacterium]|nr:TolC family protein [Steroidobacteraceae bacterium]